MRVAIRRTLRVGRLSGTPVEDLGVVPDERHDMTRRDVLQNNVDLLEKAGSLLAAMPRHRLDCTASFSSGVLTLEVDIAGADRLDVYVDGRPRSSTDVVDGHSTLTLDGLASATTARVEAFAAGELVAARRLEV